MKNEIYLPGKIINYCLNEISSGWKNVVSAPRFLFFKLKLLSYFLSEDNFKILIYQEKFYHSK